MPRLRSGLAYDLAVPERDGVEPEQERSLTQGDGARRGCSVSVTFDNLGEAAQLELGMWPQEVPIGEHFTVVEVLPRLLELLRSRGVEATFYVEGLNAELYPQALLSISQAGHEVALHAWRHEQWGSLEAESERALLERGTSAMRSIGLKPSGFRPPGGGLTPSTLRLLGEHGYSHVSPAGSKAGALEGLAVLPFDWSLVDAYAFMPQFAGLRERFGDNASGIAPQEMGVRMVAALREAPSERAHLVLIFHPFSFAFSGDAGWEALDAVLGESARLEAEGALGLVRMDEAARSILAAPEGLRGPPTLERSSWTAASS